MHDRRAYHGVAVAPVAGPTAPGRYDTVPFAASSELHAWETHNRAIKKGNDDFHFGVNEALQRRMRRQRVAEWRKVTLGIVQEKQRSQVHRPRYDHLTKFGVCELGMVDELAAYTTATDVSVMTMSDGVTRSSDRSQPSSLSTSGCTTFVNYPSVRLDGSSSASLLHSHYGGVLHGSSGPPGCSANTASLRTLLSPTSVDSTVFSLRKVEPLRDFTLRPCNNGHAHRVKFVLLVPQGDILLSCSTVDRHVTAYHLHLKTEVGRMVEHDDVILGGAVSPNGRLVATASRDCSVILWELPSCKQRRSLPHPAAVHACCFAAAGTEVATVCADGLCRVWSWSDVDVERAFVSLATGFNVSFTSLAYSLGDRRLLAGGATSGVFVWDRQHFNEAAVVFREHHSAVLAVDASHTLPDVVASADERNMYVWNCQTLAVLHCIAVDRSCVPHRRSSCMKGLVNAVSGAEPGGACTPVLPTYYWTAARLVDSRFGTFVVAAASDKCAHMFQLPGAADRRHFGGNGGGTAAVADPPVAEVVSIPLSSSLSAIGGGPCNVIALGDMCGNRYLLTLM
jgi:hypothetical protein